MKLNQIVEKYKKSHKCKTPDAIYSISIKEDSIDIKVKLPYDIDFDLTKSESEDLEADLHYAVESVLAKFF